MTRTDSRFVEVTQSGISTLAVVSGRDVSSVPPGAPATAPAETVLTFAQHVTPTDVVYHHGGVAPALPIQLLFWGDFWNRGGAQQRSDLEAKIQELLAGPFTSRLDQYWVAPPTYRGSLTVTKPGPPTDPFDGSDVRTLVWALIDDSKFPEPDDDGGYIGYMVFMPPGTTPSDPEGPSGAHTYQLDWPFDAPFPLLPVFDLDWIIGAWIKYSQNADDMAQWFTHELVELITDPLDDGWYNETLGHKHGEIADLCQPGGNDQTAWVGNVRVGAYWSARDQACVIPTHPFSARLDGTISVKEVKDDASGETPPGSMRRALCAFLPACCMDGPYKWTRRQHIEDADLTASASGYRAPAFAWMVAGQPLSGSGSATITATVTRESMSGPDTQSESVTLQYKINNNQLTLSNDSVVGNFDVIVTATVNDAQIVGAQGDARQATVAVPFIGSEFVWPQNYLDDLKRCQKAADEFWKQTHPGVAGHPGPPPIPDPWGGREEREKLVALPAWVSEEQRRAAKVAVAWGHGMAEHEPEAANELQQMLLGTIGIPTTAPREPG
jgi:hypothetical protein